MNWLKITKTQEITVSLTINKNIGCHTISNNRTKSTCSTNYRFHDKSNTNLDNKENNNKNAKNKKGSKLKSKAERLLGIPYDSLLSIAISQAKDFEKELHKNSKLQIYDRSNSLGNIA